MPNAITPRIAMAIPQPSMACAVSTEQQNKCADQRENTNCDAHKFHDSPQAIWRREDYAYSALASNRQITAVCLLPE
jgi:hypothetical protein